VQVLPERTLQSLSRFKGVSALVTYIRRVREAVEELRYEAIREVVGLLVPDTDDRLFELMVGFQLIESAAHLGWQPRLALIPGSVTPFAQLEGSASLELYWQRPLWGIHAARNQSQYRQVREMAGLRRSLLRPDFLLRSSDGRFVLPIEVKHTTSEGLAPDHAGIVDALAYLQDAGDVLQSQPKPHALVIAWGTKATPNCNSRVAVGNLTSISSALDEILHRWAEAEHRVLEVSG
jgi:hypothetical protein